jgi:hypothetical protein
MMGQAFDNDDLGALDTVIPRMQDTIQAHDARQGGQSAAWPGPLVTALRLEPRGKTGDSTREVEDGNLPCVVAERPPLSSAGTRRNIPISSKGFA